MNVLVLLLSDGAGIVWFNSFGQKVAKVRQNLYGLQPNFDMNILYNIICNDQDKISNIIPNDIIDITLSK